MPHVVQDSHCANSANTNLSVLIVEDHDLIRLSVKLSLENCGRIQVVGEAKSGSEGVRLAKETNAQVILMDLGLPGIDGIEATRQIKQTTASKVVVLTSHSDEESVISALKAGADGFLMKDTKTDDLLSAVYSVAHGAAWLEDSIARKVAGELCSPRLLDSARQILSEQDIRIINMINAGGNLNDVANELCLPLSTVHEQLTDALRRVAQSDIDPRQLAPIISSEQPIEKAMVCTRCRQKVDQGFSCPDDGADLEEDTLVGTNLTDRYLLLSLVGVGGNASVYKAKHCYTGKTVAIKVLHRELGRCSDLLNRFRQEAVTIAALEHPNLISVFDFGMTGDGLAYMVMDYLEGASLVKIIREGGPLNYRVAVPIFLQVCEGVERAHEAGVIHRDLKPGNVHILNQGKKGAAVKVLDFGLAKVTGASAIVMTVPGEIFGSPAFMSPEQCRGAKLDIRTDVYSMGCLMYQVLCGEPPFTGQSAPEVMYHQIYSQPAPFAEVIGVDIPCVLEMVVNKCMEKNPKDRYQSMHELKQALEMCAI